MRSRPAATRPRALDGRFSWRSVIGSLVLALILGSWVTSVTLAAAPGAALPAAAPIPAKHAYRAACPPAAPGYVACMALIRTDLAPRSLSSVSPDSPPAGFSPSQLRAAYGLPDPSSGSGSGLTVAIVDASDLPTAAADLAAYRSQFGLSPCTTANGCFTKVDENGGTNYPAADPGWSEEIALDIEMVSAICPNCHILLVEASSTSVQDLGIGVNTAVSRGAAAISNSYGGPEFGGETFYESTYFDHPGVAITASSGDAGYGVQFPASSPHIVSVGGTSLSTAVNPRGWTEAAWAGAGSGCSTGEPKPSWQTDPSCAGRTVADVSAVADPLTGVAVYQGGWNVVGGTSVSSPIIAGVYALAGKPTAGTYPGSYLYAQAGQLNDVTTGSNGSCGGSYLCTAATAYDGPTGLGTPNGLGAFISPVLPGAPTSVTGTAGDTTVAVSWHAAAAHGHPITGYTATASPGGHTCTTTGALSCTVNGLTNGSTYTFRVTATNSVGSGPASSPSAGVIPATVPGQPTAVLAAPVDSGAAISWTAPASNGGSPITSYTATSSPAAGTCTTTVGLSCTVLGLTNGTPYTFTVQATNVMGSGPPSAPSSSVTPIAMPGATYVPVTPNRLVDSRTAFGLSSGLTASVSKTFTVINRVLGDPTMNIPSDAIAVTGNLTVTGQTAPGSITLSPLASSSPGTSTLNFPVGDNRGNGLTVELSNSGTLSVVYAAAHGATTNIVFDVTGYFVPAGSPMPGATYVPVTPNRLVDSRTAFGLSSGLTASVSKTFTVINRVLGDPTMNIPSDAIAVTGNLTVTGQTAPGSITLSPLASSSPGTSTLNFPVGDNRGNGLTVELSNSGTLSVVYAAAHGATTNIVFDVTGYFVPAGSPMPGATYVPVTPNRLVDSRTAFGLSSGLTASVSKTFTVINRVLGDPTMNIPSDAIAVTGNLTVTGQTAPGSITLSPLASSSPGTSTLNFPVGDNRGNGLTVELSNSGTLSVVYAAAHGATTNIVFDVTGYFVPAGPG